MFFLVFLLIFKFKWCVFIKWIKSLIEILMFNNFYKNSFYFFFKFLEILV